MLAAAGFRPASRSALLLATSGRAPLGEAVLLSPQGSAPDRLRDALAVHQTMWEIGERLAGWTRAYELSFWLSESAGSDSRGGVGGEVAV